MLRSVLVAALLLALTGCSAEPAPDPVPEPEAAPVTPSPSSVPSSVPALGLAEARLLVARGEPLPAERGSGEVAALYAAAERGDEGSVTGDADEVALALRAGADLEQRDADGRTPLLLAATYDKVAAARVLVAMGADPDALDGRHDTPWLVTGVTGSVAMGEVLIAAGADLTIRNRYGGVSVIPASERGHADYVRWVVTTGIDVDHVNDLGWTALLEAVILGDGSAPYQDIVGTLLAAGADRSIADRDGVTALEHAEASGQSAVAELLRG